MMPVTRPGEATLPGPLRQGLADRQARLPSALKRPEIQAEWKTFQRDPVFKDLQDLLDGLFHSKCAYCEGLVPRDIEQYYPKSKFPERMYRWDNLLFACKNCNTDKGQRFPMDGTTPLLIDPCKDDPATFITWDLTTGRPVPTTDAVRRTRADATLSKLPQLSHASIAEERRLAARYFLFLLLQALEENPSPAEVLSWLEDELQPTRPWRSVRRQIVRDPGFQPIITDVMKRAPQLAPLITSLAA